MIINTTTPDLEASKSFYEALGFNIYELEGLCYAVDTQVVIYISTHNTDRIGTSLYHHDWSSYIEKLSQLTNTITTPYGYLLGDSSGAYIRLLSDKPDVPDHTNQACLGSYAGLSIETADYHRCIDIWSCLGFDDKTGDISQGWVTMTSKNDGPISIMKPMACPHIFGNPGLTYFYGQKNESIITDIRRSGVAIAEEVTVFNNEGKVDNVILQDPGGLTFFIFNDG